MSRIPALPGQRYPRGTHALGYGLACVLLLLAACGDKHPTATGPRITLESSAARSATIGRGGGSVSTTASDGTVYTLEVPEGALMTPQQITITPISRIRDLGLSGGLAGAVELEPSGLRFADPALLRIRTSKSAPAGTRLVGFSGSNDFTERSLAPAAAAGGEVVVLVFHFSQSGVGFGTIEDVRDFAPLTSATMEGIAGQVFALPTPWDAAARTQAEQLARQAFEQIVLPGLESANSDAALVGALMDYGHWRHILAVIDHQGQPPLQMLVGGSTVLSVPSGFQPRVDQALVAAAEALRLAVDGNLQTCGGQGSLQALKNAFFWHRSAVRTGIATVANGLDLSSILRRMEQSCARVALLSSNLPPTLEMGQQLSLDLRFGLAYRNGTSEPTDFEIRLRGSGVTIQDTLGFTGLGDAANPLGFYTTVIRATSVGTVRLEVEGCLVLSDRVPPQPDATGYRHTSLCGTFDLTSGGGTCVVPISSVSAPAGALVMSGFRARASAAATRQEECEEPEPPEDEFRVGDTYVGTRRFQGISNEFAAALIFNTTRDRAIFCAGQTFNVDDTTRHCGRLIDAFGDQTAYIVYSITFNGDSFVGQQIDASGPSGPNPDPRNTIRGTIDGDRVGGRQDFPAGLFNTFTMDKQ